MRGLGVKWNLQINNKKWKIVVYFSKKWDKNSTFTKNNLYAFKRSPAP